MQPLGYLLFLPSSHFCLIREAQPAVAFQVGKGELVHNRRNPGTGSRQGSKCEATQTGRHLESGWPRRLAVLCVGKRRACVILHTRHLKAASAHIHRGLCWLHFCADASIRRSTNPLRREIVRGDICKGLASHTNQLLAY